MKKLLPERLGSEVFSKFDYAIGRVMETGEAFTSKQFPNFALKEAYFTFKAIKSDTVGKEHQVQMHIRYEINGTFDIDVYIDPKDFTKATSEMISEMKRIDIPIEKRADYRLFEVRYFHEGQLIHSSLIVVRR